MKYIAILAYLATLMLVGTVAYDACNEFILGRWYNFTVDLVLILVIMVITLIVSHAIVRELQWQKDFDKKDEQ